MPLLTNYSMKMSNNIDQFWYVEKLTTLTQLYLELRLPLHDALRAAEAAEDLGSGYSKAVPPLRVGQLNFSGGSAVVTTNTAFGTIICSKKYRSFIRRYPRGVFFMLIEQRIAVIGGTSGIGFAVESKGLHSSTWRVGQAGDAF